ncbi:MAG: nicotinamidase [Candidatus Rokuibacteriota bacterium]|nr:MAG: nicotinamidase [Candidatus Rokubacteria bacterium]
MSFQIDPTSDALVIVDVQNDFCPGGALPVPDGDRVVPVLNRYAARFASLGGIVFATRDWHPARTKHFKEFGGVWPPHCVQDTSGAAFHPELSLPKGAQVVSKGMDTDQDAYSAFQAESDDGQPFAAALAEHGVQRLFIGGLATDYCVKATALDALANGFEVVILEDAVRAVEVEPGDGARAFDEIAAAGGRFTRLEKLAG